MITPEQIPQCFYRISLKALILNEKKEFMLCKEHDGTRDFPGGGTDHGESYDESIRREIKEETGMEVTSISKNPCYFLKGTSAKGYPVGLIFYEVKVKDYTITPSDECVEIKFYSANEASKIEKYQTCPDLANIFNPNNH